MLNFFFILLLIIVLVLIILSVTLYLKVRELESKLIDFSPTEAYTVMENMRDMLRESQRVADKLDESIRMRESVLEDISVLLDEKIARLFNSLETNPRERDMKQRIFDMHSKGATAEAIARDLGISVTEVRLALNMAVKK